MSPEVCIRKRGNVNVNFLLFLLCKHFFFFTQITSNAADSAVLQSLSTLHHQPYESHILEAVDSVAE